jgi:ribosomal subunit interface protein
MFQIRFHGLEPSPALTDLVNDHFDKLRRLCARIVRGRVAIELSNHHHRHGDPFRVGVQLTVPGHAVTVSEEGLDAYAAVGAAFDAARRQLLAHQ